MHRQNHSVEAMRRFIWISLTFSLVARLILSTVLPLTDKTEARYAEIARLMLETGNWVTPQYDYGVPFWAKPPLSTWLSAGSMGIFGVNEFAVRLPELLLTIAGLWLVWFIGKKRHNFDFGLLSAAITASLPLVYIAAGAVMTDASLAFCTTLSFVAFWHALTANDHQEARLWGYLFFIGQGLGLLAKGPVCMVLTFGPIILWMLPHRAERFKNVWKRLPWVTGSILMLVIAVPWYLLAEQRTPGFLDYFIVGEHFKRFLVSGWHGDKYGHPHIVPIGMIWWYWFVGALPWSLILFAWLARRYNRLKGWLNDGDGWLYYLVCWAIFPMLFFTLAHNALWTYPISGLPALGLIFTEVYYRLTTAEGTTTTAKKPYFRWLFYLPGLLALIASLAVFFFPELVADSTQKQLAQKYMALRPSKDSALLYVVNRYYSSEFYTNGKARHTGDIAELNGLLTNTTKDYIAIDKDYIKLLPKDFMNHFKVVATFGNMALCEEITATQ